MLVGSPRVYQLIGQLQLLMMTIYMAASQTDDGPMDGEEMVVIL